jgi:S-adenosylmethionine synthetase
MFTSEAVTAGHPDKLCDQISDAIVDNLLQQDRYARVLTECAVSKAIVFLSARFAVRGLVDFTGITRRVIEQVGYDQPTFNGRDCCILTSLEELPTDKLQSFDERTMSDEDMEAIAVSNQATLFGFACNQTPVLMPLPIWLARKLAQQLDQVRLKGLLPYLAPDGKTQVGVEYRDRQPYRIHSITLVASQQEANHPPLPRLHADLREAVIDPAFQDEAIRPDPDTHIFINPNGAMITGGPLLHSGLTGRKNGIDTYGEYAKQSGAALSGKDPLRIDRIGAYAARHAAKTIVAAGLAEECEVQLSYSIGQPNPVSIGVETFGTGVISEEAIIDRLKANFDFRLAGILKQFDLRNQPTQHPNGFYQNLAAYGHMGRADLELPWEQSDRIASLQ